MKTKILFIHPDKNHPTCVFKSNFIYRNYIFKTVFAQSAGAVEYTDCNSAEV